MIKLLIIGFLFLSSNVCAFGTDGCDSSAVEVFHADGADASTTFTDLDCDGNGVKALTAQGNAQVDTAQFKFWPSQDGRAGSALLDGTSDGVSAADSPDFDFTGGVWTVDCWARFNSLAATGILFSQRSDDNNYHELRIGTNGSLNYYVVEGGGSTVTAESAASQVTTNTWYHLAVTENGDNYTIWKDGAVVLTVSDANRIINLTGNFYLGMSDVAAREMNGWIDECRVSKGKSRYPMNGVVYTVPTSPYCSGCEMNGIFD